MFTNKFQQLENEEQDLIACLSLFDNFPLNAENIFTFFKDVECSDVDFFDTLHDLSIYGWLKYDNGKYTISHKSKSIITTNNLPKADNCFKIIKYFSDQLYANIDNVDKVKEYVPFIKKIFENTKGNSNLLAVLANDYSHYLHQISEKQLSKEYAQKAVEIQKAINEKHPQLPYYYNRLASRYMDAGELKKTLDYSFKCVQLSQEIPYKNHFDIASTYNMISTAFDKLKKHKKSITYGLKAIEIVENKYNNEKLILSNLYHDVAVSYYKTKDYNNASRYVKLAIQNYRIKKKNSDSHLDKMEIFLKGIHIMNRFEKGYKKYAKYFVIGISSIIALATTYLIFF